MTREAVRPDGLGIRRSATRRLVAVAISVAAAVLVPTSLCVGEVPQLTSTNTTAKHPIEPAAPRVEVEEAGEAVQRSFAAAMADADGRSGVAFETKTGIVVVGDWSTGPAWSTIKVPLAVAALAKPTAATQARVVAALRYSDNDAALALWQQIGSGRIAAQRVEAVLARLGDRQTRVQSEQIRPPYSPFGQTIWRLDNQVAFAARLACVAKGPEANVHRIERTVTESQRWGLGRLPDAHFKGGWGPLTDSGYLVRQFGDVLIKGHRFSVAFAAEAESFEAGQRRADLIASWLKANLARQASPIACA